VKEGEEDAKPPGLQEAHRGGVMGARADGEPRRRGADDVVRARGHALSPSSIRVLASWPSAPVGEGSNTVAGAPRGNGDARCGGELAPAGGSRHRRIDEGALARGCALPPSGLHVLALGAAPAGAARASRSTMATATHRPNTHPWPRWWRRDLRTLASGSKRFGRETREK
jgi:hypothetical protein